MEVKYDIRYSEDALNDIAFFKKLGDKAIIKKINKILDELELHPKSGSGQIEQLRFDLTGFWSRRINREHRILYKIDEEKNIVYIYKMKGHY